MSFGRRHSFWFDENGDPQGGWVDLPGALDVGDVETRQQTEEFRRAFDSLTAKQKFVVELSWGLRDGETYSLRQIAELMGLAHLTVKEHYDAAMTRLRATLTVER